MNSCTKYFLLVYGVCLSIPVSAQPGNVFFGQPIVHQVHIDFKLAHYQDSLNYYKTLDDVSGKEKFVHADLVINGDSISNVGIRLRGSSSYNHPGNKKPLQVDFNEFVNGQKYDGLKKINLNNSYLDPTQLREKLCLDLLKEAGIPAPRCTYAAVYFNQQYIGLYKAIEPVNKDFLEAHFGNNSGHLYKCEPNMPLTWEGRDQSLYYDNCQLSSSENNNWSGLLHFMDVINHSNPAEYEAQLKTVLQLDEYLRSWAANVVLGNLDSYVYLPHNYYLYDNPATKKMNWINWDMSLSFGIYTSLLNPESTGFDIAYLPENASETRPLNYYCLNIKSIRQQYLQEVCQFMHQIDPKKLDLRIDSLANLIRPYVKKEPKENRMFTDAEFEGNLNDLLVHYQTLGTIPGLKSFIVARRANILQQLKEKKWVCTTP